MAKILIIEPHAEVRELLARVVTRLGHEAVETVDGDRGASGIDAALVEPAARGSLELLRELYWARIPIVCVSIYPATADVLSLGPVEYLLKPFALTALERAVDAATTSRAPAPLVA